MATEVAHAYVSILPSLKGFKRHLQQELQQAGLPEIGEKPGRDAGSAFTRTFKEVVRRRLAASLIPSLSTAAAALVPLLPAVLAPLTAGVASLGTAFVAAGVGAAGFGAIAIPMFKHVTDAQKAFTQAREAYDKATTKAGREAALKREQSALAGLTTTERELAKSLDQLKKAWGTVSKALQPAVFQAIQPWLRLVTEGMKFLAPVVRPAAKAIQDLGQQALITFGSPFWSKFFHLIGTLGGQAIQSFGVAALNLAHVFANLVTAFAPLTSRMLPAIAQLTQRFAEWSDTFVRSQGFQKFVDYVTRNGPRLLSLLGSLAVIVGKILVALAPLAEKMLQAAAAAAKFLSALPPDALLAIGAAIAAVVTGGITALVIAVVALTALIIRHWGQIKHATVTAWNAVKNATITAWNAVSGFLSAVWSAITSRVTGAVNAVRSRVVGGFNAVRSAVSSAMAAARGAVSAAWHAISSAVSGGIARVIGLVRSLPGRIRSALGSLGSLLYNAGRNVIQGLINGIISRISGIVSAMRSVTSRIRGFLPFSPAKEGPLSGSGNPENSGAKIGRMLADGIYSQRNTVARAANVLAAAADPAAASTFAAARGGSAPGSGGVPVRVVLDVTGADEDMKRLIRRMVRVDGRGDVQAAFGRR